MHSRRRIRQHGQELVEFAIIFPVLVLFVFGVIDLGRVFHAMIAITNAAREGTRSGTAYLLSKTGTPGCYAADTTKITTVVKSETSNMGINSAKTTVSVSCPGSVCSAVSPPPPPYCEGGMPLRVNVTYNFSIFMTGFWPQATINLHSSNEMMVPYK